jgi:Domain of unknown function (DUF4440)
MTLDEIRGLEKARFSAMMGGDVRAIADVLHDDLVYIHSTGLIDSKTSYLEALRQKKYVYESVELVEEQHVVSDTFILLCQVLQVRIRLSSQTEAQPRVVTASSLWVASGGRPQLIAMQSTPHIAPG